MFWVLCVALIPLGSLAAWLVVRRPMRDAIHSLSIDHARDQFRLHREGLEARFLTALARVDPIEKLRWDEATWPSEVVWARDRRTRRLLALVGVTFEVEPFGIDAEPPVRHSTALFEFRKGKWHAEGKRLDEIRPDEAFIRNHLFEPVPLHERKV